MYNYFLYIYSGYKIYEYYNYFSYALSTGQGLNYVYNLLNLHLTNLKSDWYI